MYVYGDVFATEQSSQYHVLDAKKAFLEGAPACGDESPTKKYPQLIRVRIIIHEDHFNY